MLHRSGHTYYQVMDEVVGRRLRSWHDDYRLAELEIQRYLRRVSSSLGGETPFYKADDKGIITSINFRFSMGLLHEGWRGIENTNWLIPESDEVKKELAQLPRLPSHRDVNKLIGWPEIDFNPASHHAHIPGYRRFATAGNRQVRVMVRDGSVYLGIPKAEMFSAIPDIAQRLEAWQPPGYLQEVGQREGRKIERYSDFSKSPLGQVVSAALSKALTVMP